MQHVTKQYCPLLILLILGASLLSPPPATALAAQANESPDRIWRSMDKNDVRLEGSQISSLRTRPKVPENARFVQLDPSRLRRGLNRSTARISTAARTNGFLEITLPLPDGTFVRFAVQEAPLVEPGGPPDDIKSYRGQAVDDPSMTVRFNQTTDGISAFVLAPSRTFYIDPFPLRRGDNSTHVTFFRKDYTASSASQELNCLVGVDAEGPAILGRRAARQSPFANGEALRTYRVAIAATGEYTQFHGGAERARQAIFNTLARVNLIYERDLAINMVLVANHRRIIYTDPANDPYTNSNSDAMLSENQTNLDKPTVIGSNNYDIGHVFGVGAGGVALLRSVGQDRRKAGGVTGSSSPIGDAFDVDYVAHEMGHQFGGNHTFNGTTSNCGGGNRNPTTAYEPGSGSTIMAYAGICGVEDLQTNSDPFFHVASLEEIITYVTSVSVGTVTPTNNRPPSVNGGDSFTIPKGTPFVLTASGTDPDNDPLTYSWEQYDLGEPSPPDDDIAAVRPIFRAFGPLNDGTRIFPRMDMLLAGSTTPGELLPARSRAMSFRVIARDNRSGGGGISYGAASVMVNSDAGPFVVTQPEAAASWQAGSTRTVTWNVAGTSAAPLSTTQVKISISTDGGKTFNALVASAPNNGSATITVPNTTTTAARIKVEAIGNVYFSVSRGNFSIVN